MIYPHDGNLLSHEREPTTDKAITDETQNHSTEWQKPEDEESMLCESIYIKF